MDQLGRDAGNGSIRVTFPNGTVRPFPAGVQVGEILKDEAG